MPDQTDPVSHMVSMLDPLVKGECYAGVVPEYSPMPNIAVYSSGVEISDTLRSSSITHEQITIIISSQSYDKSRQLRNETIKLLPPLTRIDDCVDDSANIDDPASIDETISIHRVELTVTMRA